MTSRARQGDGELVVAGAAETGFVLARYAGDGNLGPTFGGGDGMVTAEFDGTEFGNDVVLQPDGKVVAAGYGAGYADAHVMLAPSEGPFNGLQSRP